jgi:6-pyruvoyltetrahydropterin/6-carboxytetrahydropterin synthase
MYQLDVETHFDAAHYIKDYTGKCARMHGHRWTVVVALAGEKLDEMNILIDFSTVKLTLKSIIDEHLDHYQLNDSLGVPNLTAEYLAKWLFDQCKARILNLVVLYVKIWESPDCCATYYEDVEEDDE